MSLSRIERGLQNPDMESLIRILQELGLKSDEFIQQNVTSYSRSKPVNIPSSLTSDVTEFLGYLLGDGNIEYSSHHYWVQLTDRNRETLKYYQNLVKHVFNLEGELVEHKRNRLKIYSAPFARYLKKYFSELIRKSPERDISPSILRSPLDSTKAFLRGLFDAEGYLSNHSLEISMSSSNVIRKIQLLLLRHNIISHYRKYPTHKTKNLMHKLQISDRTSLQVFKDKIGFNHPLKHQKLLDLLNDLKNKPLNPNRPQFPPIVRKLIRKRFKERELSIPSKFYGNTRGISRTLVEEAISHLGSEHNLEKLLNGDLMWSKVRNITISRNQPREVWDLSVPGPANFVANGIITHNSGGMFTRFVEDGVHETHDAILIHTAGQAPRSVRRTIRRLRYELNLPTFLFVDADPWGAHIAMVIISGSASAAHLRGLATPDAIWMGVWASDIQKYNLPSDPFTDTDKKRTQDLLKDPRYQTKFWQQELKLFFKNQRKAEQQAFSRYGLSFVTEEYLPNKFKEISKLQQQGIL
jgi:intein/homing endonuclease